MLYPNNSCCCTGALPVTSCTCEDPGIETVGRHLSILDHSLCQRRLANSPGFLTARQNGSNGYSIAFTLDPAVAYTTYEVGTGDKFSYLVASMGDSGFHRRIVPTAAGWLKTNADGTIEIGSAPAATVPDPLTVNTLNAGTVTATTLDIDGVPTFTGLQEDEITQVVGLNADNELVKGSALTTAIAMFYENSSLLDATTPNISVNPNQPLTIGNTIIDSNSLTSVVNSQNIRIEKAGLYRIEWFASVRGFNPGSDSTVNNYTPSVQLAIGAANAIVNFGQSAWQSPRAGGMMGGVHVQQISAGTGIWLVAGPEGRVPAGIRRLQLILTKLA